MAEKIIPGVLLPGGVGVGNVAPDFELPALIAGAKKSFRLSSLRGQKNVVLAFYPFNWQAGSAQQMKSYQVERPRLQAMKAETVGITVDSIMNTTTWEREIRQVEFPLCSDFWPHGEVCARYGVLRETGPWAGASERAIFVVDRAGRVAFRNIYEEDEAAELTEIFAVLEKI
jgi:peroxiredoxin